MIGKYYSSVWRVVLEYKGEDSDGVVMMKIEMNPPGKIGGNFLQGTRQKVFKIFSSVAGMLHFTKISASWHGAVISENAGYNSLFKSVGRENFLEVEKGGQKKSKTRLQLIDADSNHAESNHAESNHPNSIYADTICANLTNISPINQHNSTDFVSLQKSCRGYHMIYALIKFLRNHKPVHFYKNTTGK